MLLSQKPRHPPDHRHSHQAQRQQRLEELHASIASRAVLDPNTSPATPTAAESKEIARLHNDGKRHEKYRQQRTLKSDSLHQLILQNEEVKSTLEKQVSRMDQLIEQEMVRMDLSNNDNPADSQIPPPLKKPQSRGTQLARPFVKSEVVE